MNSIVISVPEATIERIEKALDGIRGKTSGSVLKTAVNNTATKARRMLAQKVSAEYTGDLAKKSAITSRSDIKKAAAGKPVATINFKSPVREIKDFHVSSLEISKTTYRKNGKRGGKKIKGNVLKGSPKPLEGAFVVKFKTGHVTVVQRAPGTRMKSKKKEKIHALYSPSDKAMVGGERVYGSLEDDIHRILAEQVETVFNKALGR